MQHDPAEISLAERKQRFVQSEIRKAAFELFISQGFEDTTVDEIAEASGISRRTFFRYFETKEDVIVAALGESGEFLLQQINERPDDEAPAEVMKRALQSFLVHYDETVPNAWLILNMIQGSPKLRAKFLYERDLWLGPVVEVLVERSATVRQAEVIAATGLGILTLVYDKWNSEPGLDIAQAIEEAFAELYALNPESNADGR